MKKQVLFLLVPFAGIAFTAQAKIKYTDVKPDTVLAATSQQGMLKFEIDMDKDGNTDFYVKHFNPGGSFPVAAEFYTEVGGSGEVLVNGGDNPLALEEETAIKPGTGQWVNKAGAMFSVALMMKPTFGGLGERYVGVRIKKANKWHYGWVKMSVSNGASSMTVYEYALNETADETIAAGQTAPTDVAELVKAATLHLYPNPVSTTATIESSEKNSELYIYNQYGQQVKTLHTDNEGKAELRRDALGTGIYYYELKTDGTGITKGRFMIAD